MSNPQANEKERQLEQLVAYLDGELAPDEVSLVERHLAEDADLRHEMESIERAWSALDALPTTKVDDRFAQTTMEMVVGVARDELVEKTRALPVERRKSALSKILLTTAAAFLGLLAVRLIRENPNRTLIADLPTIAYIDIYTQFRNIDFLKKLNAELPNEVWVADLSEDELTDEIAEFHTVTDSTQRRDWVTSLDDDDRRKLLARYNRFTALSTGEQSRLRQLHASLVSGPESEMLERTMLQYRDWLSALPASRQYELRDMPVDDRVREIANQVRRAANNPWIELSPEETRKLELVRRSIRDQIFRELGPPERGEFGGRQGRDNRPRGPNFGQQVMRQIQEHRDQWLPQILAAISDEHRIQYEAFEPRMQQQQLVRWVIQARDRNGGRGPFAQVTLQELERFFVDETDPSDKERLLALPREQMEQELRRRYLRSAIGEDFGPEGRPFGPPRGGRGGPGSRRGLDRPGDRDGFERPPFDGPPPPRPGDEF